jgi:hypothetical protein
MRRLTNLVGLALVVSACAVATASAQTFPVSEPSRQPGFSIAWSQLHESYGHGNGGEIDLLINPRNRVGIVINAGINGFDGFSETTLLGGLRYTVRRESAIGLFGQLLAGIERCGACKTTDPTIEPAAGVDLAFSHRSRLAVRVGAGYRITPSEVRTFKETHVFVGLSVRPR